MNFLVIFLLWLAPAVLVVYLIARDVYELVRKARHYSIIYSFCEVRDAMALMAVEGKISEDSEVFRFFYRANAQMIHEHLDHGWCYLNVMRKFKGQPNRGQPCPLSVEIKQSDVETKHLAAIWARSFICALLIAAPFMLKDAIMFRATRWLSQLPFMGVRRESARFGLEMANAAT